MSLVSFSYYFVAPAHTFLERSQVCLWRYEPPTRIITHNLTGKFRFLVDERTCQASLWMSTQREGMIPNRLKEYNLLNVVSCAPAVNPRLCFCSR